MTIVVITLILVLALSLVAGALTLSFPRQRRWLLLAAGASLTSAVVIVAGIGGLVIGSAPAVGLVAIATGLGGLLGAGGGAVSAYERKLYPASIRPLAVAMLLLVAIGLPYSLLATVAHFTREREYVRVTVTLPAECSYRALESNVTCQGATWRVDGQSVTGTLYGTGEELFAGFNFDPRQPGADISSAQRAHVRTTTAYASGGRAYTEARAPTEALEPGAASADPHALGGLKHRLPGGLGWAGFLVGSAGVVGLVRLPGNYLDGSGGLLSADQRRRRALAEQLVTELARRSPPEPLDELAAAVGAVVDSPSGPWRAAVGEVLTEAAEITGQAPGSLQRRSGLLGGLVAWLDADTFSMVFRVEQQTPLPSQPGWSLQPGGSLLPLRMLTVRPVLVLLDEAPRQVFRADTVAEFAAADRCATMLQQALGGSGRAG